MNVLRRSTGERLGQDTGAGALWGVSQVIEGRPQSLPSPVFCLSVLNWNL